MCENKKIFLLLSVDIPENVRLVIVGRFCSAYGILGWIKVVSFTEKFDNIIHYQPWYVCLFLKKWYCLNVDDWKKYRDDFRFIVKLKEVDNRNIAQQFSNCEIFVDVSRFPSLSYGEYYWKDILGCHIVEASGCILGVVVDLIETGANDVLVVKCSGQNILIPFINQVIKNVDCLNRIINVNWDLKS